MNRVSKWDKTQIIRFKATYPKCPELFDQSTGERRSIFKVLEATKGTQIKMESVGACS